MQLFQISVVSKIVCPKCVSIAFIVLFSPWGMYSSMVMYQNVMTSIHVSNARFIIPYSLNENSMCLKLLLLIYILKILITNDLIVDNP